MESKSTDIPPLRWQVKIGFGTKPIQFRRTISTMVAQLGGRGGEGREKGGGGILRWNNLSFESLYGEWGGRVGRRGRVKPGELTWKAAAICGAMAAAAATAVRRTGSSQFGRIPFQRTPDEFSNFPSREIRAGLWTDRLAPFKFMPSVNSLCGPVGA